MAAARSDDDADDRGTGGGAAFDSLGCVPIPTNPASLERNAKLESFFLRSSPSLKWLQATRPRSCASDLSFPQSGQTRVVPRAAEESQPSMMRSQKAYTFQRDARNRPFVPWTSPTKRDRRSRLLLTDRSAPIVDLFHPESQRYVLNLPGLGFSVPNMS